MEVGSARSGIAAKTPAQRCAEMLARYVSLPLAYAGLCPAPGLPHTGIEDLCRINFVGVSPPRARRLHRMARRRATQITIDFGAHGGARAGAGRKPRGARAGVKHSSRGALGGAEPVLVTMKILAGVANLRTRKRFLVVLESLRKASERFGSRIVEYSVQSDHVHLMVETTNARALARAMQGLAVRLARALNRTLGRRGKVFADRFHHRVLSTPRQVRNALAYVLCNARKHRVAPPTVGWLDPLSSALSFGGWLGGPTTPERATPLRRTWLLRVGWRRGGLLDPSHVPSALA